MSTGIDRLDQITNGLASGTLTIIGGRPSMGKTSLAVQICDDAERRGKKVVFVSLEMSDAEVAKTIIYQRAKFNCSRLYQNPESITKDQWEDLGGELEAINKSNWSMLDIPGADTERICAAIEDEFIRKEGIDLVCIDYLQLIGGMNNDNLARELGNACARFKQLARKLNIPIIVASQLNRGVERRTDKRPVMSDLHESGGIESNADIVLLCYRPAYYDRSIMENKKGLAEIIVAKNRMGPVGSAYLFFQHHTRRFYQDDYTLAKIVLSSPGTDKDLPIDIKWLQDRGIVDEDGEIQVEPRTDFTGLRGIPMDRMTDEFFDDTPEDDSDLDDK
jgi:replicative DNA helicase